MARTWWPSSLAAMTDLGVTVGEYELEATWTDDDPVTRDAIRNALCLFWGPTPASRGDEPRAAAPVAVVAKLEDVAPLANLEIGRAHV